ncbi:hypothetical protein RUM43_000233 [Polyplax serrata]|uniref:Microtubule-associated protein futsch n=1 Tax=Polyplax serrata TaxID=468196 RepID=A0AAN8SC53_POLSC
MFKPTFLSWDLNECHVSLEKELEIITGQAPEGEEARFGERLIQYATENLVTEILIHPQLNTLHQCMKNLLSSFTKHRHIIHAGYTFAGNGSWILQDGTLSISDLIEALHEPEVLRVLKAYENSVSIDVHCAAEGDWKTERFQREPVTKLCSIRVNPGDVMTPGNPTISSFISYLSPFLEPANIQQLLQPTDVVGNIRFTHPTLYVFPGGQGDAALFGINGFNMLIDGGFARKACFWDFARHLDRLDAVLLTRLNNSTVNGISAVLQRKKMNHVYPQIGHFFCNLQDRKIALSPDGDKDKDSLIVNLAEEGQEIVANLRHLALKPHPCYRDGNQIDPVNLYHKVGHGKLDMYVISPARDSQAVKEFLAKWTTNDSQLFSNTGRKVGGKSFEFPLQNLVSICALLVWQPANPNDTITRILFPGSTPQHKIFEGLEKLRHLEFLRHPICSVRNISPPSSRGTRSVAKNRQSRSVENRHTPETQRSISTSRVQKISRVRTEKTPSREVKAKVDTNKLADEKKEVETTMETEPVKKLDNRILTSKDEQIENIKKEIHKIEQAAEGDEQKKKLTAHRSKYDMRNVKSKVDSRAPSRSIDRKKITEKKAEKESETSPPTTPKKALVNGTSTKKEKNAKTSSKPVKTTLSPSATPAKSAKEANNRKVVEARMTKTNSKSLTRKKEETPPPQGPAPSGTTAYAVPSAPATKVDRKAISRRPKGPPSPAKSTAIVKSAKTDAEPKKVGKKLDVDVNVAKAIGKRIVGLQIEKTEPKREKITAKIEPKPVDEIEIIENKETDQMAVNRQPERNEELIIEGREGDEDEVPEEEEEYLIITKEESTEESVKGDESVKDNESVQGEPQTEGEGEIKKLLREEEESEKKQKPAESAEEEVANVAEEVTKQTEETVEETEDKQVDQGETVDVRKQLEDEKDKQDIIKPTDLSPGPNEPEEQNERKDFKDPGGYNRTKRTTRVRENMSKDQKEGGESLPEEKISNTLETSATTAPTLPEDEKVEDHIVEEEKPQTEDAQEIVEEKYIQEDTKEDKKKEILDVVLQELPVIPTHVYVEDSPGVQKKPRDVVKTPDEVADLPMHEEVDPMMYSPCEFKDLQKKLSDEDVRREDKQSEVTNEEREKDDGILQSKQPESDEILPSERPNDKSEDKEPKQDDSITSKYLNIIDELEKTTTSKDTKIRTPKEDETERKSKESDEIDKSAGRETKDLNLAFKTEGNDESKPETAIAEAEEKENEILSDTQLKSTFKPKEAGIQPETAPETSACGKSSHHELEKSGKSTPEKQPSGKATPENNLSGKSTPKYSEPDENRIKDTPGEACGSPVESQERRPSVAKTPNDLENDKIPTGMSAPRVGVTSGRSTPLSKTISGKTTPEVDETKKTPCHSPKGGFPGDKLVETPISEQPRISPTEVGKKDLNEPSIVVQSGASTAQATEISLSGKSTPQDFGNVVSNKTTPRESGTTSPLEGSIDHESEKPTTPSDLLRDTSKVSTPKSSGKSTPLEKERSATSTPQRSRTTTPHELNMEIPEKIMNSTSGTSTPIEKERSATSTPQRADSRELNQDIPEKLISSASGKSTPKETEEPEKQESGKATPSGTEHSEPTKIKSGKTTPSGLTGNSSPAISGKSTPLDLDKVTAEIAESHESGKTTPSSSEKGLPKNLQQHDSGTSTPRCLEKDTSRKATPLQSGKTTPSDFDKDVVDRIDSEEDIKKISVTSTPPKSGTASPSGLDGEPKSTPHESGQATPTSEHKMKTEESPGRCSPIEKGHSSASTPYHTPGTEISPNLIKTVSDKLDPQEREQISPKNLEEIPEMFVAQEGSGKSTLIEKTYSNASTPQKSGQASPQELETEIPQVSSQIVPIDESKKPTERDSPKEGSQSPVLQVSGKVTPSSTKEEGEVTSDSKRTDTPQALEKDVLKNKLDDLKKDTSSEVLDNLTSCKTPVHHDSSQSSGKNSPSEKEHSRTSTPQRSGASTPHGLAKISLQDHSKTPSPNKECLSSTTSKLPQEPQISLEPGTQDQIEKIFPVDMNKQPPREISEIELYPQDGSPLPDQAKSLSGKSTPQDATDDTSNKSSLPRDEKSGQSTPQSLRKESILKDASGRNTPIESDRQLSSKTSPDKLSCISSGADEKNLHTEKDDETVPEASEVVQDEPKKESGSSTPLHIGSDSRTSSKGSGLEESDKVPSASTSPDLKKPELQNTESQDEIEKDILGNEKYNESGGRSVEVVSKTPEIVPQSVATPSPEVPRQKEETAMKPVIETSESSGPHDKDGSGKSTPISGKPTSDSVSIALAEKGTSATYTSDKESLAKSSSPSPVDISPLSLDEIKEGNLKPERSPGKGRRISDSVRKNPLERLKYEDGDSSRASTPDRSTCERSDSSVPNGMESEEELEKGILESEKQEKESQIFDVSSGEEEELKALDVDDDDSDAEVKRDGRGSDESPGDIGKDEKEDINQLVKTGVTDNDKEFEGDDQKSAVKRMLVTASSEDGGTETEICIQGGVKTLTDVLTRKEDDNEPQPSEEKEGDESEEFSNLILQAKKEYLNQRTRKTSGSSPAEDIDDLDENASIDSEMGSEREELGTLVMQARQELAFVRSRSREDTRKEEPEMQMLQKTQTTKTTETTRTEGNEVVIVTTTITEERQEQEDGTVKVTTKTEVTTRGGKQEGTTVRMNTFIEGRKECEETEEEEFEEIMVGESGKIRAGQEDNQVSRRTSTSSIISQEDLVCRKDSGKIDDIRRGSSEMSPLKTTYITSYGDSESLMTSSFYGNLPMEDEMRAEHLRAYRKAQGYESVTEIGPNGEKMERTYFYGTDDDPVRLGREKSRFVKTVYTEEDQKGSGQIRYVHRFYASDIPEEEGEVEKVEFVQRLDTEEEGTEKDTYRFVKASFPTTEEQLDFAKAIDEHLSVRGEHLGTTFKQDTTQVEYKNGTFKTQGESKEEDQCEASSSSVVKPSTADPKRDVIEGWGKPLGLPLPPKHFNKAYPFPGQNISTTSSLSTPSENSDSVTNWGQPMSLPSPAPPSSTSGSGETVTGKTGKETPRKEKLQMMKSNDSKGSGGINGVLKVLGDHLGSNTPNRRSQSPVKASDRRTPSSGRTNKSGANSHLYLDLTYVPHHGNSYYINVEFFKKVRARYYVFSGTEPSKEVYNALLEAKQTWEDKNLEVTIIPTYDTDILGYWVAENEEILAKHKIDLSPSASRCTINLQDHETSCSAYRLEF